MNEKKLLKEELNKMKNLMNYMDGKKSINELVYYHNGSNMNQVINYDDDSLTNDLEFLGQGSMDGQDFKVGSTYEIGGNNYKVISMGDELKLTLNEAVEMPTWLKGKLEDVHGKVGQGSIFAKPIDTVLVMAQKAIDNEPNIDKIANTTGTLTIKTPNIGYNLVLPIEQAKKLPNAKQTEVEKIEGPNKIKVPAIQTSAPINQFSTDELTIIVRPKKDESGSVIKNEYIVLSAFPGDPSIPRASEWNGRYAVIIPS
jgi:hypothetical protein